MAPPILYFLRPSPPSRAVLLTAKTLGVELTIKNTDVLNKGENLTPQFIKMNPAHTVPTLDDNGFYIWESRAIMGYLVQQYGKDDSLYPKDPKQRASVDNMLFWDAAALYSSLTRYFVNYLFLKQNPSQADLDRLKDKLSILDAILKKTPYAAGEKLTIADISLLISVTSLEGLDIDYKEYVHIDAWANKLKKELIHYDEIVQPGLDEFRDVMNSRKAEIGQ